MSPCGYLKVQRVKCGYMKFRSLIFASFWNRPEVIRTKHTIYHQTFNISRTLIGNKIVDHSDVVGAPFVAQLNSPLKTWLQWIWQRPPRHETRNIPVFGIGTAYTRGCHGLYSSRSRCVSFQWRNSSFGKQWPFTSDSELLSLVVFLDVYHQKPRFCYG